MSERPIIVFDGLCPLCSSNAAFVLRRDRRRHFRVAAMQTEAGAALYRRFGIDPANPETLIVVTGDDVSRDSEAMLAIASGLGWPWRLAAILRAIPRPLRDRAYRWLARNRYRLFGRRETCWMPSDDYRDRMF